MRISTILAITASIALSLGGLYLVSKTSSPASRLLKDPVPTPVYDSWIHWKQRYGRAYGTDSEEEYRLQVFYSNFKTVFAANTEQKDYQLELNTFADLTSEEFLAQHTGLKSMKQRKLQANPMKAEAGVTYPDSLDWTTKGAVTPIKDQGQCGSCWAFSTTGGVEGAYAVKNGELKSFSEQQLVDCAGGSYGNMGCNGGLMDQGFDYVKDHGLELESDYRYTARDGTCKYASSKVVTHISGYTDVTVDDNDALMAAVNVAPVSVAIDANPIQFYRSGVFTGHCGTQLDHGVLLVGYGTDEESGHMFWKVKNSWGTIFGEDGYFRLIRKTGKGVGQCGITRSASYPKV